MRAPAALARLRGPLAGPLVAALTVIAATIATRHVGLPLRDPDHVAALYFVLVGCGVAGMVALDVLLRARARSQRFPPPRAALQEVRRERWTPGRGLAVAAAVAGFYLTYMAYRNLKSIVPLLRPGDSFDRQLAALDRDLFAGSDPAVLMHALTGSWLPTQILSTAYVAFIVFLPLTIGVALVFARSLRAGLFYTTAQSINWVLGAGSYFLLPSLGPIYTFPATFAGLPASEVTRLQGVLLDQRLDFLRDPGGSTPQSIAAFASLHISMSFTALLAAYLLGLGPRLKAALWAWFAVTATATVHFGWHYVLDDIAGVAMGAAALGLARVLTGIDPRALRTARAPAVQGARDRPAVPAGAHVAASAQDRAPGVAG